jgi:hypothetical protein
VLLTSFPGLGDVARLGDVDDTFLCLLIKSSTNLSSYSDSFGFWELGGIV